MKVLGIDYGTKRIGLAISDETQSFARELDIYSPTEFWEKIESLVLTQSIIKIVIGWPTNLSGQETAKTKEVAEFKNKLATKLSLPIETVDERLSSKMAMSLPGGEKNVDSLAAQILLQNYLDRVKSQEVRE